ncbi:MAG: hypothetical protein SGARI_004408, partial [Bacillariaceae sp.]
MLKPLACQRCTATLLSSAAQTNRRRLRQFSTQTSHSLSPETATISRTFLSTQVKEPFSVPLTLTDVFLRHEQLPFAYAFRATLDKKKLVTSFQEILKRYPILGASVCIANEKVPTLEWTNEDTVPFAFGTSDQTLDEWLAEKRSGSLQHSEWRGGGGPPILSPLFDDLHSTRWEHGNDSSTLTESQPAKTNVATIRVTYFRGGGTAVGINVSHLLGDANTCFRICQVWGRAMRGLTHPLGASNNRSEATLTGMVTPEMAEMLNLGGQDQNPVITEASSIATALGAYWNDMMGVEPEAVVEPRIIALDNKMEDGSSHEYVILPFSLELTLAMKNYGMSRCSLGSNDSVDDHIPPTFVSTNDMITAFGWIMKRHIANQQDWNLSMVVNLRNRGEIDGFSCLKDNGLGLGLFGNALTSVVARLPPSGKDEMNIFEIGDAAIAIRRSFIKLET